MSSCHPSPYPCSEKGLIVEDFNAEKQAEMIVLSYTPQHGAIRGISNVSFASGHTGISVDYADGTNIRIAGRGWSAWETTGSMINPGLPSDHPNYIIP